MIIGEDDDTARIAELIAKGIYGPKEEIEYSLWNLHDPDFAPVCYHNLLELAPELAVSNLGKYLRTMSRLETEEDRTVFLDEALELPVAQSVLMNNKSLLFGDIYPTIKSLYLEEKFAQNGFCIKETPIKNQPGLEKEVSISFKGEERHLTLLKMRVDYKP